MVIEIKKENYKHLVQCVYLGNLIINEYQTPFSGKNAYSDFLENILTQIVTTAHKIQPKYKFINLPNEPSPDRQVSDLYDKIDDSVNIYYEEYRRFLFCEMLADRIADINYPVTNDNEIDPLDNLLAKNLYFELLKKDFDRYVHIEAPKIDEQIKSKKLL